jgi:hypothetical protein
MMFLALIVATSAVAAGCAATPTTSGLVTPWGAAGIHSFKPQKAPEPDATKVNRQVAQLLDDASQATKDSDVRVAAAH